MDSKEIYQITVRVTKNDSSFVYFTLESNEGISFYSTLPFSKGQMYRDLIIYSTPELSNNLNAIIEHLTNKIKIEILDKKFIQDE